MSHFCPAYPKPSQAKRSIWSLFFSARYSWLSSLTARSYRMQMGEVHLPGIDLYMVNDPALVQRVLSDEASNFPKSALLGEALAPLLGESIFTTNGAQWKRQRGMMNPAFAQARLNVAFPVMRDATNDMMQRLAALPDGAEHDVEIEMTHVTADIIFRTIFSKSLKGAEAHRIFEAFSRYQALAPRLMLPAVYGLRWLAWPWERKQSRRAAQDIRGLLELLIRPRYDAYHRGEKQGEKQGETDDENKGPTDILASFLAARDADGKAFDFEELVNQVAMLFLAGHETSASALTWALYLLANSPDVQQRAHQESVTTLGKRPPEQTDMKDLKLTSNIFRETLRLFPPVGFFARQSARACPMRDKQVPQSSTIVIAPWLIQRHRDWWTEPDAFNPDRYDNDASRDSLRQAYLPFSMGPRVCLGAAFALQEAVLILTSILRQYRLEPVPGHTPMPVGRLTVRSDNGVRLHLHKRDLSRREQWV